LTVKKKNQKILKNIIILYFYWFNKKINFIYWKKGPSFTPINVGAKSILKVAIRSVNLGEQSNLINGLKRLNKSDPSVEVYT
jgi:translation elongation factor EF-G